MRNKKKQMSVIFVWDMLEHYIHPLNQVQPFCKNKEKVYLLLTSTISELNNIPKCSSYYSIDKKA